MSFTSLIPRPSPLSVFDHLLYAQTIASSPDSLGTRLHKQRQKIKNWSEGRPGNETTCSNCTKQISVLTQNYYPISSSLLSPHHCESITRSLSDYGLVPSSQLLEHVYPALLDAEQTPQQVEIFVPLVEEWAAAGGSNGSCLPSSVRETGTEPIEIGTTEQATVIQSPSITLPHSDPERLQTPSPEPQTQLQSNGTLSESLKPVVDLLSPQNTLHHSLCEQQSEASSWEVIHHSPSSITRLSLIQDFSSNYFLVPMWECLQEAFKTPVIRLHGNKLMLRDVIPDLLFADLPPESIFRNTVSSNEHYLMSLEEDFAGEGTPSGDVSGLFVRMYYNSEDADVCARKPAGALKTVSAFFLYLKLVDILYPTPALPRGKGLWYVYQLG